jgi:glycosyltransferase involved in cell wall biosynthesis
MMTLARAQRASDKDVEFVTFRGKKFGEQVRREGFRVHEVRVRAKVDPVAVLRMRKIIRDGRFDVVHTHLSTSSVNGCLAAKFAGVSAIATVHGFSGKMSFFAADHLIAVSDQVRMHLVAQGVDDAKISVVYNGLEDLAATPRDTARRLLDLPVEATVIGTVARVTALKGIDDAIKAFAKLAQEFEDLIYVIVGDGDALPGSEALARELGVADRIRFVGYQSDVSLYLSAFDLFLFPSLKEAMGIALAEAMAAKLPIVSTNVGGIPEVLPEGTGILVEPRSPDSLALATSLLLRDSDLRNQVANAAKARATKVFSASAMERSTVWVYRELLGLGLRVPTEEVAPASQPV